jgi:DNA replication protein DnaC
MNREELRDLYPGLPTREAALKALADMGYPLSTREIATASLRMSRELRLAWYSSVTPSERDAANQLKVIEAEAIEEEIRIEQSVAHRARVEKALENSGLDQRTQDTLRNTFWTDAMETARSWWEDKGPKTWKPSKVWLVLRGKASRGKTVAGAWALQQAAEAGRTIRCADGPLLSRLAPYGDGLRLLAELTAVDVLLIDDYGKEAMNDTAVGQFFRLCDKRHGNYKPTIITSNNDGDELGRRLGTIAHRIKSDGVTHEVIGEDLRLKQGALP